MINKKQISLIHVAKAKLGLSEEEYRTILKTYGYTESSRYLDDLGMERVMQVFRELGFKKKKKPRRPDLSILASEAQRKIIYHLMEDLGWIPRRLYGFIQKMTVKDIPEQLTKEEASKVIEGLKKIRDREIVWQ